MLTLWVQFSVHFSDHLPNQCFMLCLWICYGIQCQKPCWSPVLFPYPPMQSFPHKRHLSWPSTVSLSHNDDAQLPFFLFIDLQKFLRFIWSTTSPRIGGLASLQFLRSSLVFFKIRVIFAFFKPSETFPDCHEFQRKMTVALSSTLHKYITYGSQTSSLFKFSLT